VVEVTVTMSAKVNVDHCARPCLDRRAVEVVMDHDVSGAALVHLDQGLSPALDHRCFFHLVESPEEDAWHYHLSSALHSLAVPR